MTTLKLGPRWTMPVDMVTETIGILAVKRSGKSNAAVVMAEELYDVGVPWVAIDPKGDWWGIRAAGNGKSPGLEVVVFGGEHGDVILEPTGGRLLADLIVNERITCVLDVSEMSKASQRKFLSEFAQRLYQKNREPLHVFCEEADEYIPQMVRSGGKDNELPTLVGAFETLVKRGGFRGIGITLITQRSASLNKDVLTQVGTLITLRTPSPQDRKAILEWVNVHELGRDVVDELPHLANGQAWVFSPEFLQTLKKVQFRQRRTFDSGATPKIGQKIKPPARLADVDLDAIRAAMAETLEKAAAEDPKLLRKKVADQRREIANLDAEVARLGKQINEHVCDAQVKEVPVLGKEDADRIETVVEALLTKLRELKVPVYRASDIAAKPTKPFKATGTFTPPPQEKPVRVTVGGPGGGRRVSGVTAIGGGGRGSAPAREAVAGSGELTGPEQRILDAIKWWGEVGVTTPSKVQVGFVAGYRAGKKVGGAYGNYLGALRAKGYITYPSNGACALTDAGFALAGDADIEQTSEGVQAVFLERLSDPEQRVMRALITAYPDSMTKQDVGAAAGYTVGEKVGGAFGNYLGRLRSLGLIDYPAPGEAIATAMLFLET